MTVGELKRNKEIKNILQNISNFFDNPMVQRGFKTVGQVVGSTIPVVGGQIGKKVGESIANRLSYATGLAGEIVGGSSLKDILSYIPNRIIDKVSNGDMGKVMKGEMNWRDAVLNTLEENAMINILAPGKTHAWKDEQGNYYKEYVDGAKMVVGEWHESTPQIKPSDNGKIVKITNNGEVIREGWI